MASYILKCDDADPESQCDYSSEGNSADEVYLMFMKHVNSRHWEKIRAMSPQQLETFERRLRKLLEASQS